ncbi:MAG: PqqD family protein [Kiritimatiellae bacterium]|nr:PqqD family protein [Kiritimatiellia bacterium]
MLRAVAMQNRAARVERAPDATVSVWVQQTRKLMPPLSWIVPFRKERVARLDHIGSRVWSLCDGRRTVEDVVDTIAAQYRLTFHESRVAVTGYLKTLVQRGVLAIEMAEEEN